jgi:hypothetical protein
VLLRRRRAGQEELLPPPELGQAVDYTSLPYEEPTNLGDRLREAPIGVKLLLALVPIAVIVAAVVLWLTFFNNTGPGVATVPTPSPPPTITNVTARLASASRIVVDADTNLPDTTQVSAAMKDSDQDLPWFNKDAINTTISNGRITVVLEQANNAPKPTSNQEQFVTLIATVGDQVVSSEPAKLTVPALYKADFYRDVAAVQPTTAPTAAPTAAPAQPTAAPTAPIEPTVTPTATLLTIDPEVAKQVSTSAPPATGLSATVFNGGNVRARPVTGKPLDQIHAGETVQLLAKTSDGGWYQISYTRDGKPITGWVSVTLLKIDPAVAKQVPVAK